MPAESKYREDYPDIARKLCMLLGATNERLSKYFEVSDTTIDNWIAKYPEFAEAVKFGRELADADVVHATFRRAIGYSHPETKVFVVEGKIVEHEITKHYPPDTGAAAFWLKNRQGWRDKVELTGGGPGGALELLVVYEDEEPPDPDANETEASASSSEAEL